MRIKYQINTIFLFIFCLVASCLHALNHRNCLILLDQRHGFENVGSLDGWYLTSRLQSAIAEQSIPILLNAGLWNSFIERRIHFKQSLQHKESPLCTIHKLYQAINERIEHLSHQYNAIHLDVIQNKHLIVQSINDEFYNFKNDVSAGNYQLLVDYFTPFDPQDWNIYKNGKGFYLFIPKKYSAENSLLGFNIDSLEEVAYPEDSPSIYFDTVVNESFPDALHDFFLAYDDFPDSNMPYAWNILLAGHGGSDYEVTNQDGVVTWNGQPIIADLTVQEFNACLDFFRDSVKTHFFHYSSCYAGGNHIPLIFKEGKEESYNYAIICDSLTDSASFCKSTTLLPSTEKMFLTTADLTYDATRNCWQLSLAPVYYWKDFFNDIATIDFSIGSIERLQEMMSSITYSIIANIPLLCLPGTNHFFPLYSSDVIKIDERLLTLADDKDLILNGVKTILLESSSITMPIVLDHIDQLRIISIKPGDALHYIKKLYAPVHIDLPSTFWQAQYQYYDKTFILDECSFPQSNDSLIFNGVVSAQENELVLKNVIIAQQRSYYIRLFFTVNDVAMMVVAHKPGQAEHIEKTTIQEVVILNATAREKYEEYYLSLKKMTPNF